MVGERSRFLDTDEQDLTRNRAIMPVPGGAWGANWVMIAPHDDGHGRTPMDCHCTYR